ncbi:putative reverse transcriptase domain-containing protein [Tanacetum coccineum]|uniref:Reverse transcriptase domain-containing protein n=1 Tax=Tanacetum coccineum TaxID=301880 RepID=A0ABQ5ETQ0_9ASTR
MPSPKLSTEGNLNGGILEEMKKKRKKIRDDSDTESRIMAVAPTLLIMSRWLWLILWYHTRVPYFYAPFSGTFYVGSGSSRQVFAPGPTGRDVNTLHHKVKGLAQQMVNRANTEHSTLKRLSVMDQYLAEFDTDLRSEIKGQHALRQSVCTLEDQIRELVQGDREENKKLKTIHYRERPYVAPTALVAPIASADPGDPLPVLLVIMPPKRRTQTNPQPTLTREAADQLVREGIEAALSAERERVRMEATRAGGPAGGPAAAPVARECSFMGFMKCGPTQFHGNEGAVELCRWFEKIESVFGISECAERSKVKFVAATLQGRALTWWNSQVATLGLDVVNGKSWTDMRKMMMEEFCPDEEVQRLENELRSLKLRDTIDRAYITKATRAMLPMRADRQGGNMQGQADRERTGKETVARVPVIRKLPEVFPDDLPGLPPPRQVEFRIELVPGAAPVVAGSAYTQRLIGGTVYHNTQLEEEVSPLRLFRLASKPYLDKFVIVFIDDILIYSKNKEKHKKHLKIILELLKKEQFFALRELRTLLYTVMRLHQGYGAILMQEGKGDCIDRGLLYLSGIQKGAKHETALLD